MEISERDFARDTLERYSDSKVSDFQKYILLTNFPVYVDYFSEKTGQPIHEGSMLKVCHDPVSKISMLDYKIGSPAAALAVDLLSYVNPSACLMLGMCGGLRRKYKVGDYLVPVASIRGEGTSDFYFPARLPALANFFVQRSICEVMEESNKNFYMGITHSTNVRLWEFNKEFRQQLIEEKAQAVEMECATLFVAGYKRKLPIGALLLISDKPLEKDGIKTKAKSKSVKKNHTKTHVDLGIDIMEHLKRFKNKPKTQMD